MGFLEAKSRSRFERRLVLMRIIEPLGIPTEIGLPEHYDPFEEEDGD